MLIECEIVRLIHTNENFQLLACVPIGEYDNLVIHPKYHTITIKDTSHRLVLHKIYTLEVSELPNSRYGMQYLLEDIPSLSFNDVQDITDDQEFELLQEIMTKSQAEYVHDAYPDFIRRILTNQSDTINVKNIYNVSDIRLGQYIHKVSNRYNAIILRTKLKYYNLSQKECELLLAYFGEVDKVLDTIETSPYFCLVHLCERNFRSTDLQILEHDIKWKYTNERIEHMMDYAISMFEYEGSTYVDANRLVQYIYTLDADVVPKLKDVAMESGLIVYNEEQNILQRLDTYHAEKDIADILKKIMSNNIKLDWAWNEYTKIKDGELTEEQQNVLKTFCESNVIILDAPSGTGKTSSLMALIQMIEDYGKTYIMMSPTGKAASRLSEQTGRPASTIHRATLSNSLYDKEVIIVDESSMLSVELMCMILKCDLLDNCRLIFVGDSAQIPSIGLGRVFKDMGESGLMPTCTLTKCFRFEEGGASYVSTLTRQGKFYLTEEQLESDRFTLGEKKDYEFIRFNHDINQIIDTYMSLVDSGVAPHDIMLLVPYNIGTFGATNINNLIQERLNPINDNKCMKTKHNDTMVQIHPNDLVMNIKNNYNAMSYSEYNKIMWEDESLDNVNERTTSVFNGQTGVVKRLEYSSEFNDNILVVDIEGEDIIYTREDVNNLLLAYASNPYKFQGSQCKYIINVVIPTHARSWNRNLLYTSQTRMTTKLIEIGDPEMIYDAIQQNGDDSRKTRLKEFLCA